jgi:hypothetical protein
MSPRFAAVLDKILRLSESLNERNTALRPLVKRAFSEDLDKASDAIRRIEKDHDGALAAVAWGFFWIRQGEMSLAKRELKAIHDSDKSKTLWGGLAVMMLGELCVELGEPKAGAKLIRRAEQILGTSI